MFFRHIIVIMESNYRPIMETSASILAIAFYLFEGYAFKLPIGSPLFEIVIEK